MRAVYKFDRQKFSEDLREYRQKYLYYETGISRPTISRIVNGDSGLKMSQLLKLCEAIQQDPGKYFKLDKWQG